MNKFVKFIKKHILAIILSLVVGLVMIYPVVLFQLDLGESYQGIYLAETDNEEYYTARAREVFDGHPKMGNAFIFEDRDSWWLQPPLGEIIFYFLGKIFFLSEVQTIIFLSKFFLPACLFLMIYIFCFKLFKNRFLSIASALFVVLAAQILFFPSSLVSLFLFDLDKFDIGGHLSYTRPVIPQVSSIFFFLFLILFYELLTKRKILYLILSGIIYGLIIYIYLYNWIFLSILQVLILFYFLFKKNKKRFLKIFYSFLIGILVSLPYFLIFLKFKSSSVFAAAQERYNLVFSHEFVFSKLITLALIFLIIFYFKKKKDRTFKIFLVMLLTGLVGINQQVLTGVLLFRGHFHWYFIVPTAALIFIFIFYKMFKKYNLVLSRIFLIFLVGFSFAFALLAQNQVLYRFKEKFSGRQKWMQVYEYLEQEFKDEIVVLGNNRNWSMNLPIYTHHYPYIGTHGTLFLVCPERLKFNFFVHAFLRNVKRENIDDLFLDPELENHFLSVIGGAHNIQVHGCLHCLPIEFKEKWKGEYIEFLENQNFEDLDRYKIDVVVWDKGLNFQLPRELEDDLSLIFKTDDFDVYKYR